MKTLGKIRSARFGTIPDYPFLLGLDLEFSMADSGIGNGGKGMMNMSKECKWSFPEERNEHAYDLLNYVLGILNDAKVNYVEQLKGIPVEIEIEGNVFQDFRILTEVL